MVALATNLGFPRIGPRRELKASLEAYWAGKTSGADLQTSAADIRSTYWRAQAELGFDHIPSGDFSLYDHVLDTAVLVGAIPDRYQTVGPVDPLDRYFAMARGGTIGGKSVTALEMTKWFDTNYHYLVPELSVWATVRPLVHETRGRVPPGGRHRHHDSSRHPRACVIPHAVEARR